MDKPIQVSDNLFWVNAFNGMQFTVVFKRFYVSILSCTTEEGHVTDSFLSRLSDNIFVIYPYISSQADFGYSDATSANNQKGRVPSLFMNTLKQLQWHNKVRQFYHHPYFENLPSLESPEDIALPTYIINLPNRTDRKRHIELQFAEHEEFDLHFVNACSHSRGNVGLWQSICKIVKKADMDGEDVVNARVTGAHCVVIGNEGHGVSEVLRKKANKVVSIPMQNGVESLNAAVSAGIIMYALSRK